jgi:hypothetical protein
MKSPARENGPGAATHRAKRTGMIHVHARPLLAAVVVTIGTMATQSVLQHSDVVSGHHRPPA